ncbi:hypothetical protein CPB97_008428 [Podila verticillata]|nr:hypothetical protein CPB97_008428 [Podila verticillata]
MTLSPRQDPLATIVAEVQNLTTTKLEVRIQVLKDGMRKTFEDLLDSHDKMFQSLKSVGSQIDSHQKMGTLESNRDTLVLDQEIHDAKLARYRFDRDEYMRASLKGLDALYDELRFRYNRPLMALLPTPVVAPSAAPHARGAGQDTGASAPGKPQVAWNQRPIASGSVAPSGKATGSKFSLDVSVHATESLSGAGAGEGTSGTSSTIQATLASNKKYTTTLSLATANLAKAETESPKNTGQGSGSGSGSQPIIIDLTDSESEPEPEQSSRYRAPSATSSITGSQPRPAKRIRATTSKVKVVSRTTKKPKLRAVALPKPSQSKRTDAFQDVWLELQQKITKHKTQTTLMEPRFKSLTMETFGKHGQTMPTFRPLETTKTVVFSTKQEVLNWTWLRPVEDQTEVLYFSSWTSVPDQWAPSEYITQYNVARQRKEAIFFEMMAIITLLLNRDEAKRLKLVLFSEENSLQSLLNPLMHSRQHHVRMAWCTRDYEVFRVCGLDPIRRA